MNKYINTFDIVGQNFYYQRGNRIYLKKGKISENRNKIEFHLQQKRGWR